MSTDISKHSFYKNFSTFLTPNTKSAEKTIKGRQEKKKFKPPYKFGKEFYSYLSAGGLLIFPILALCISEKNVNKLLRKTEKELFKITGEEGGDFFQKLSRTITKSKYYLVEKFWEKVEHVKFWRERYTDTLRQQKRQNFLEKIFNGTNRFFKNLKIKAANRKYLKVKNSFSELEKCIEKHLSIIEDSSSGKVKIAFPRELLKNPNDELPHAIDLSKTADGKNRVEEIRKILAKIKTLLANDSGNYDEIVRKITFSCEDIFAKGEATLLALRKAIATKNLNTPETEKIIHDIYNILIKYRFAEKSPMMPNATSAQLRSAYTEKIKNLLSELREKLPQDKLEQLLPKDLPPIQKPFTTLENLVTQGTNPQKMGLLEQLRMLLKCNDIPSDILADGAAPAALKHYMPNDYIKIKRHITEFGKDLKFAEKTKKDLLPQDIHEINRGGIFTKGLSVGIPAALLGTNIWYSKAGEEKAKSKRNFYSFIVGSAVMLASNYCTMNSQKRSIIYGILAAFLTSRIAERYIKQ